MAHRHSYKRVGSWLAVGLFWALLGACVLVLSSMAQAKVPPLPFKPGHYVGHTNQTCPADPIPAGACRPGQKLGISFTVTKHAIRGLSVPVVVEQCEILPRVVHTVSYPSKPRGAVKTVTRFNEVASKASHALFAFQQDFMEGGADFGRDQLKGTIRKATASGRIASLITVDSSGELDSEGGDTCVGRPVSWQARRANGSQSMRAGPSRRPHSDTLLAAKPRRYSRPARPQLSWTIAGTASEGAPIPFSWSGRRLGRGHKLVVQRPVGTGRVWKTILRLPSSSGSGELPGMALGNYRLRLADFALVPRWRRGHRVFRRRLVAQRVAGVGVFGQVPFTTLLPPEGGSYATPTASFAYATSWEAWDYNNPGISVPHNHCSHVHIDFVPGKDPEIAKKINAAGTLTLVQESSDPVDGSAPFNGIGSLDADLVPGQSWAVNASYTENDFLPPRMYVNGYAVCSSTEPFSS